MKRSFYMLLVVLLMAAVPALADEIILRQQATPAGNVVRLGDVAEIRAADSRQAQRLAAIPLMPAAATGSVRYVRSREIADMVAAHGENISQLRFTGASQVAVQSLKASASTPAGENGATQLTIVATDAPAASEGIAERREALTQGRVVSGASTAVDRAKPAQVNEQVQKLIADYLTAQTGRADGWRVTCNLTERQSKLLSAAGSMPTCGGGNSPWTGKQRIVISLMTADGPVEMPVMVDVLLAEPVFVATRPITRGALITAADVEQQTIDTSQTTAGRRAPVHILDELVGKEAARAIQAGEIIFTDQVKPPLLVKRGETITIVAQGGGIRVSTAARARQDGAHGELVQVESLETKERYDARVIGLRQASVLTATAVDTASPSPTTPPRPGKLDAEVTPFRKYLPVNQQSRDATSRQATAFRNYIDNSGSTHGENR